MKKGDEASPSIVLACQALELLCAIGSKFEYIFF